LVFLAGLALEILEHNIGNCEIRRELEAQRQVALPIALVDLDGVVDVVNEHSVVGHVLYHTAAATSLKVATELRGRVGPNFNTRSVL
jgi:hypothetical protein